MYKQTLFFIFFLFYPVFTYSVFAQEIVISANKSDIQTYNDWLDNKHCSEIKSYQHKFSTPATIQILIICKAIHLGGIKANISFVTMPNYSRSLIEAQKGTITIPSDSIWLEQINKKQFFFSKPIFKIGEFQKGFFALPAKRLEIENAIEVNRLKGVEPRQTLRDYSIISSKNWMFDSAVISKLGMTIINTSKAEQMCRMIDYGRGDLYLGEIIMNGRENLSLSCNGIILEPIKGIKVSFNKSRHFVVSKDFPNSQNIFQALQKGLEVLRQTGEIDRSLYPFATNKQKIDIWEDLTPIYHN